MRKKNARREKIGDNSTEAGEVCRIAFSYSFFLSMYIIDEQK